MYTDITDYRKLSQILLLQKGNKIRNLQNRD